MIVTILATILLGKAWGASQAYAIHQYLALSA